jgi:uncharacterized protein YjbJ (UPF0337 family)
MTNREDESDEVTDAPATWENVAVGEAKEVAGRLAHNEDLTEEGEEQVEIAHEVREQYREQRDQ